ncbi:MAG: (2Fe-2S) ferredoxin domain-containing protein [Cyanobacteria bacterium J06627_28]
MSKRVLICQNTTCKQQGAKQVLDAFEQWAQRHDLSTDEVMASGCLGHCGQGPMVLVVNESTVSTKEKEDKKTWYDGVRPEDAKTIAEQHLQLTAVPSNRRLPMTSTSASSSFWIWASWGGLGLFFILCIVVAVVAAMNAHYV